MSTDLSGRHSSPDAVPSQPSFVSTLGNLVVAPREAFAAILKNPSPWLPLVLFVVMHIVFAAVWTSKMDPMEFIRNQQEAAGQDVNLPPAGAAGVIKVMTGVMTIVAPPVALLLTALVLMFVYRFFFGGEVTFKQSFAIVAWSFAILALVTIPLMLGAMALKESWSDDPAMALSANPTLFLERATTAKPLYALARSLDLFTFWLLFLVASGFGVALRKPTGSALWGVAVPWLILVLIGVGWAAIF